MSNDIAIQVNGQTVWANSGDWERAGDFYARKADAVMPPWMRKYPDTVYEPPTLERAGLMSAKHFIPIHHPSYNA